MVVASLSLSGFPVRFELVPLGLPGLKSSGEPGAVPGMAFFVVGGAAGHAWSRMALLQDGQVQAKLWP